MDTTIKKQFISDAEEQIDANLLEIQSIRSRLISSFAGYHTINTQKATMAALAVAAAITAISAPFCAQWLTVFSEVSQTVTVKLILMLAFYSTVVYFGLYAMRMHVRISQRASLKVYVDRLDQLTDYLNQKKNQLDSIYDSIVSDEKNQTNTISAERDVASEIQELNTISHEYHDENSTVLDGFTDIMYWVSAVLIGAAFVMVTGHKFCSFIEGVADIDMHTGLFWIFGLVTVALFIAWNIYSGGFQGEKRDLTSYFISDAAGLVAMPVILIVTFAIIVAISVVIVVVVGAIVIGIIYAMFEG